MTDLPLAPVGRIVKKVGAERVSSDANEALAALMEDYAARIAKEAIKLAGHAGRKTVKATDVRMAAESLK
ncbi:MAG: histone family protein [Methanomicrobiaceae archaeon]|nr:histone family protein [Methanomicrobiaceae archaeon]MDD5418405.1 histone family protein [Methanomicrobiaceae archaeon]